MENAIVLIILIVIVALAGHSTYKRFFGGGGCHGGGNYKIKKKKLENVKYKSVFHVEGMHCENCKKRVEEAVNDIAGVSGSVNLKKEELTVSYAEDVDNDVILTKLERIGYPASGGEEKLA